jgi:hypothetical protein
MGALRAVLCLAAIGSAALEHAGPAGDGRTVAVDEETAAAALVDEPHASSPLRQTASDAEAADGSDQSSARDPIAVRTLLRAEDLFEGEQWIGRKELYDDGSTFETLLHGNVTDRFINGTTETLFEKNGNVFIETTHEVRDGEKQPLEYFFAVAGFGQGWLKEVSFFRKLPGEDLDTYHFDADDIPRLLALFRAGGRAALAAVAVVAVLRGFVVSTIFLPGVIVYRTGVTVGRWALGHCRADVGSVLKLLVACAAAGAFIFMIVGRIWQDALYALVFLGANRTGLLMVLQFLVPLENEMCDFICDAGLWRSLLGDDWARLGDNKRRREALQARPPSTMFVFIAAIVALKNGVSDPITFVDCLVVKELGLGAGVAGALGWMFVALRAVVALAGVRFMALLISPTYFGCKKHGYALAWAVVITVYNRGPPVPVLQFVGWGALAWAAYAFFSGDGMISRGDKTSFTKAAAAAASAAGAPSSRPMPVSARKDQRDGESSSAAASATARAANPEISNSLARRISRRGDGPPPRVLIDY